MDACGSSSLPLIILEPFLIFPKSKKRKKAQQRRSLKPLNLLQKPKRKKSQKPSRDEPRKHKPEEEKSKREQNPQKRNKLKTTKPK